MGAMHAGQKISRRDFVKTSVVAGGALLASTVMPGQAMNLPPQGQEGNPKFTDDGLVKGVCDIHLHLRPDSRERSADEYGFMQDAMRAGYRAVMFKSNDFSCHDRAYLIRQAQPERPFLLLVMGKRWRTAAMEAAIVEKYKGIVVSIPDVMVTT